MNSNIKMYSKDELENIHQEIQNNLNHNHSKMFLMFDITGLNIIDIEHQLSNLNIVNKIENNMVIIVL